ncbi:MAG: undecaprenyl-diphosphate phosphatase [Candidatus Peribacteraceae bacterium]|nr:undecaprenyl-diphosphate phosphatase [Candidatus Peribacteraceae bacterium]MDD5074562.1 undecaprenyl-diphosphate phosphatase [Candidatus Peribacteraceae bacterium]
MSVLQAAFLGILQGFTELLPISSSGHLVIAETFFHIGIPSEMQAFDIILHGGSLLALLVCFPFLWWRMAISPFMRDRAHGKLLLFLIIATVPAAIAGVFLKDIIEQATRSVTFVASGFLFTGVILIASERMKERKDTASIKFLDVLLIGFAQALALPPGISRSGLTISAGRSRGLTRRAAVDFSFLMAVPVIAGATLVTCVDLFKDTIALPPPVIMLTGVCSSFGASVIAILLLRKFIEKHSLAWFALYLFPVALILLAQ